jgi:hypothetical protein
MADILALPENLNAIVVSSKTCVILKKNLIRDKSLSAPTQQKVYVNTTAALLK